MVEDDASFLIFVFILLIQRAYNSATLFLPCSSNIGSNKFGIGQRVASEETRTRIEQSIEYMQTVWTDEKFQGVRHRCRNLHTE